MATILEHGKYRKIECECGCVYSFELFELDKDNKLKCPECGKKSLEMSGGCQVCKECGHSKCD